MTTVRNFVLLLKAQKCDENNDKYDSKLMQEGFVVKQVKTLEFEYKNLDKLRISLDEPEKFSGIIFASPRCVIATKLALEGSKINKKWTLKDNFVVGETTAEKAAQDLDLDCSGKETGNANNLADILLQDKNKYDKPFLFPHGNLKTDILKNRIQSELSLHEICMYDTIPNPRVEEELKSVTNCYTSIPEYVVFFSPSGVNSTLSYLKEMNINLMKLVAIGPTTEAAMEQLGLNIYGTAHRPTPDDLLDVIRGKIKESV